MAWLYFNYHVESTAKEQYMLYVVRDIGSDDLKERHVKVKK